MGKTYDKRNHFYSIPANWDEHPELDGLDRYLLMKIHNLAYQRGYCFASQSALGKMIGLSRSQVIRRLRELERLGAVEMRRRKGKPSRIRVWGDYTVQLRFLTNNGVWAD